MSEFLPPSEPLPSEPLPPNPRPASSLAALLLLVLVFIVGVAVGQSGFFEGRAGSTAHPTAAPGQATSSPAASGQPELAGFELFWQALGIIREHYVGRDQLDDRTLLYGAVRGMVEALGDTGHSVFLMPEEVQSEQNALDGAVVGIGVLLGERDGQVVIVSVIPGGPAHDAGILAGDQIVAVEGQSVEGLTPGQVAGRVRGDEGTTVHLTISRPSSGERLELSIVRERLRVPAVSWVMVPGTNIAVLRLSQFSAGSAAELRMARDAAIAAGARGLILDLRGNPGGYVGQAVDVASLFLSDKTVYVRETAAAERIPVSTNSEIAATDLPLVVLVDANTASSAEIVAGALQSADRGHLVGETTFGTGTVLLPFDLPDGSSIRLAVERWLTPDGKLIFGVGITPDVAVALGPTDVPLEPDALRDLTAGQVASISDPQLLRALDLLAP